MYSHGETEFVEESQRMHCDITHNNTIASKQIAIAIICTEYTGSYTYNAIHMQLWVYIMCCTMKSNSHYLVELKVTILDPIIYIHTQTLYVH